MALLFQFPLKGGRLAILKPSQVGGFLTPGPDPMALPDKDGAALRLLIPGVDWVEVVGCSASDLITRMAQGEDDFDEMVKAARSQGRNPPKYTLWDCGP